MTFSEVSSTRKNHSDEVVLFRAKDQYPVIAFAKALPFTAKQSIIFQAIFNNQC